MSKNWNYIIKSYIVKLYTFDIFFSCILLLFLLLRIFRHSVLRRIFLPCVFSPFLSLPQSSVHFYTYRLSVRPSQSVSTFIIFFFPRVNLVARFFLSHAMHLYYIFFAYFIFIIHHQSNLNVIWKISGSKEINCQVNFLCG